MGKSTISMAIFKSYFDITRGYQVWSQETKKNWSRPYSSEHLTGRGVPRSPRLLFQPQGFTLRQNGWRRPLGERYQQTFDPTSINQRWIMLKSKNAQNMLFVQIWLTNMNPLINKHGWFELLNFEENLILQSADFPEALSDRKRTPSVPYGIPEISQSVPELWLCPVRKIIHNTTWNGSNTNRFAGYTKRVSLICCFIVSFIKYIYSTVQPETPCKPYCCRTTNDRIKNHATGPWPFIWHSIFKMPSYIVLMIRFLKLCLLYKQNNLNKTRIKPAHCFASHFCGYKRQ